jgi:quercetin dioxygenase-like cupin family protein
MRIFEPGDFLGVADGTEVSAFLNPSDNTAAVPPLPADADVSMAAGRINPGVTSLIHFHPVVTQITYVVSGTLAVTLKPPSEPDATRLIMASGQAFVAEPETFIQLANPSLETVHVLYIVSPAYVYVADENGHTIYDDAVCVSSTWEELARSGWETSLREKLRNHSAHNRQAAIARLLHRTRR